MNSHYIHLQIHTFIIHTYIYNHNLNCLIVISLLHQLYILISTRLGPASVIMKLSSITGAARRGGGTALMCSATRVVNNLLFNVLV